MSKEQLAQKTGKAPGQNSYKDKALLHLTKALEEQKYEICAEITQAARKFGAHQREIDDTIAQYLDGLQGRGQDGANLGTNRVARLLKEK